MLDEFRARGLLPSPQPSSTGGGSLISPPVGEMPEGQRGQSEAPLPGMLRYPGGVLADPLGERLFIADSGHHRVLVTAPDGEIQTVIGSGSEGIADGVLEAAQFRGPQGMALSGETLYVADTGNHSIRVVDLEAAIVDTIAGTGAPGAGRVDGGPALTVSLRSPWDIALAGRRLYIAMAGCHQLWMYDLDSGLITAVAGTGVEGLSDGPPEEALFAQPSGVRCRRGQRALLRRQRVERHPPGRPRHDPRGNDARRRRTVRVRRRRWRRGVRADAASPGRRP